MARSYARISKGIGLLEENRLLQQSWQTILKPQEGASISFDITVQMQVEIDGEKKLCNIKEGAFAICVNGEVHAYRNHCPHVGSPLDWIPNQFFSDDGQTLLCHTHGALFDPMTGDCISGPCPRGLYPITVKKVSDGIQVPCILEL